MSESRRKLSESEKAFLEGKIDAIMALLPEELGPMSAAWERWSGMYKKVVYNRSKNLQPLEILDSDDTKLICPAYILSKLAPFYGLEFQKSSVFGDEMTFLLREKDERLVGITASQAYSAISKIVNHLLGDLEYLETGVDPTLFDPETGLLKIERGSPIVSTNLQGYTPADGKELVESVYDVLLHTAAHIGSRSGAFYGVFNSGEPGELINKKLAALKSKIFEY